MSMISSNKEEWIQTKKEHGRFFKQICIIGGGHAAHTLAALLPSRGIRTVWYVPFEDEAERIKAKLREKDDVIYATFADGRVKQGRPVIVSAEASDVIPASDVLLMPVPSFAYGPNFERIKDCVRPNTFIGVTPGQGGFEWYARAILRNELFEKNTLFAIMPMPFNCRMTEYGHAVAVQSFKTKYRICALPKCREEDAIVITRTLLGGYVESAGVFPLIPTFS
jgi:ketopantoate reductase